MITKKYFCDKCDKELEENRTWKLHALRDMTFGEEIERHFFELCNDCYGKLVRELEIKGRHDVI